MPIQTPKSPSVYQQEILTALQATGIKQTAPGGKARALADAIAGVLGESEAQQFGLATSTLLPYATSDVLDYIGAIYGVTRLSRTDGSVSVLDNNFQFYVRTGTFGAINNGQDISVPSGVRIFTANPNGPVYVLDFPVTLPAASSNVSFSAVSDQGGSAGIAPASVFVSHNFTGYADSATGDLLVTNNYGIVGARDDESDDDYRFRISLKLMSTSGDGEVDIRAAVLQIPGVQNVDFEPLAGTYNLYVFGISPVVPPSLLALVQNAMGDATAYPLVGTALSPDLVGISLNTTLTLTAQTTPTQQGVVITNAVNAASNYLNNLGIGQPVVINKLADVIQQSDSRIADIGDPDKPLQDIFIWRSRADGTRYSRYLIANYTPVIGERIIVESSISNPIDLTIV